LNSSGISAKFSNISSASSLTLSIYKTPAS
jgi:hypothetical protein